ncbi:hypothetical protein IFR04_001439 [Cadophora malorum]|uniref:Kynurenine formamidase n=1 Tax=Cadophora malorum TaxID=108018 RepID=A0A8H7WII6_9HELO|nr:hypothetical protein IFR04_001439 [Cadophora malorum]
MHTSNTIDSLAMAASSTGTWESIPWEIQSYSCTPQSTTLYHKSSVPYTSKPNALQNFSLWVPAPVGSKPEDIPSPTIIPSSEQGIWIIYIHGGAWRDPLVTASSFTSTVTSLVTNHSSIFTTSSPSSNNSTIAGIASINYSLTPKTPADAENDDSRRAKHPDHILDVLTALEFLQAKAGFGENYVLLGHSCGATLALQVAMGDFEKWKAADSSNSGLGKVVQKPVAIVGLNGLYDMPTLIRSPGEKHLHLQALYEDFTKRAFGDDESVWMDISPVYVKDWSQAEWVLDRKEPRQVFLVQSKEDTLVPYWQLEAMRESFLKGGPGKSGNDVLEIKELEAAGDHNDLWKEGTRLAEIVVEVVQSLR